VRKALLKRNSSSAVLRRSALTLLLLLGGLHHLTLLHVLGDNSAAACCIAGWQLLQLQLLLVPDLAAAGLGLVPPDSKGWDAHSCGDNADDPSSNLGAAPRPLHSTSSRQQFVYGLHTHSV
jgi:hypothetical protein